MPVLDYGGGEQCTESLVKYIDHQQFELRVCTFWEPGQIAAKIQRMGVPVDVLDVDPAIRNPWATYTLTRYLNRHEPHILHAAVAEANFHAALAGRLSGTPILIGEEVGTPERSGPARAIFGLMHRLLDRTVGVSRATCDYLAEREFAPRDSVELVYNPVDASFFDSPAPDDRAESPADRPFRIITVGRLIPEKNFDGLLEAFALLAIDRNDIELQVVGDGPMADALHEKSSRLGLSAKVEWLGYRNDVRELLADADLFVLPSISEAYGIAMVEAMAAGLPVVGSAVGGIPEVLGPLADDWAVPPREPRAWADTIERIVEMSPSRRSALGSRLRERARRQFSPDQYISRITDLYRRLARQILDWRPHTASE
jgi:glycosyltransferase involved in cell wall biosynthesis